jgi:hypothetical protein
MRICPLKLYDSHALAISGFCLIEHRKRMVRHGRQADREEACSKNGSARFESIHSRNSCLRQTIAPKFVKFLIDRIPVCRSIDLPVAGNDSGLRGPEVAMCYPI